MHRITRLYSSAALAALGTMILATPISAQTQQIQEIVVTASKREENLQRVPIAVTAITAASSAERGINDLQSLRTAVPSLNFDRQVNAATPFLRGVGTQTGSLGNEPSVALYVDNVYIGTGMGSLFDFNNIERIEVSKGPQGTLFGRNAVGGVIHVLTKDPTFEPEVDIEVGVANYKTWSSNVYASAGLGKVAANIALHANKRSKGWGTNFNTGNDTYLMKDFAGRMKFLITPTESTRILLAGEVDNYEGDQGVTRTMIPGTFSNPGPGLLGVGNPGFYNALNSRDSINKARIRGASAQVEQDLGWAKFVSITGYRTLRSEIQLDSDALPRFTAQTSIHSRLSTFTQEAQLKSTSDSRLQWIVGGYYFRNDSAYDPLAGEAVSGSSIVLTVRTSSTRTRSVSGFGELSYKILPKLRVTLGGRYTKDHRGISGTTTVSGVQTLTANQRQSWNKFTYRAALDYQFTDNIMGYVSHNRGFKSGVFDLGTYQNPAVNPEILDAYEVGLKTEFLDRRLRVNVAGFRYDYSNIQVTQIVLGASRTLNGGAARMTGADLEITAVPIDNLTINAGLSILNGTYKDFKAGPHFNPTGSPNAATSCAIAPFSPTYPGGQTNVTLGCDLTGNDTIQSPPITASISATYVIPTSIGNFAINGNYYYNDGYFFEPDNSVAQDAYGLLGAAVSWTSTNERLGARIWGSNLLDKKYYSAANSAALGKHYSAAPPLTFGITASYHFD